MSDQPTELPVPVVPSLNAASDSAIAPSGPGWIRRLWSVLLIIICFEIGLFLLIYPWTDGWSDNYFAWAVRGTVQPAWHSFWGNSYVRGGISGMGVVNLWIAMTELFRMFARRASKSGGA
jgi:hypothetical protein